MGRFIFLILIFLFDLFVFQAVQRASIGWELFVQQLVSALYWLIPVAALLFSLLVAQKNSRLASPTYSGIRSLFMVAYFSKFLMALALLVEMGGRLIWQLIAWLGILPAVPADPAVWVAQLVLALGGIAFGLLIYGIFRNKYRYRVFKEKIQIEDLPASLEGLRIVQLSDVHSGSFTDPQKVKQGIDLVNAQEADLVFFTGDLVNNVAQEMQDYLAVFDKIQARYGVFSILGNHDYGDYVRWPSQAAKQQNMQDLIRVHQRMGWDLMLNEHRLIEIEGEEVAIIGVENYSAHARFPKYGDLARSYEGAEAASLKLLLSHDPTHWDDQVLDQYPDIAVTFSGHTHGMQFGFEIGKWFRWSPAKYVFKQWAGLYQKGKQYLYVNRGFGFLGYPGRVGILPEVTVVELVRG